MKQYSCVLLGIYSEGNLDNIFNRGLTAFPEQRPCVFLSDKNFLQRLKINSTECFRQGENCSVMHCCLLSVWNDVCPKQTPLERLTKASFTKLQCDHDFRDFHTNFCESLPFASKLNNLTVRSLSATANKHSSVFNCDKSLSSVLVTVKPLCVMSF